ncbi:hypothetical protein GGS20DRAFT_183430 [Poronia punctata]|nr:hypothetical protein GGS20DRAFT_183430 [Poronia punctata]
MPSCRHVLRLSLGHVAVAAGIAHVLKVNRRTSSFHSLRAEKKSELRTDEMWWSTLDCALKVKNPIIRVQRNHIRQRLAKRIDPLTSAYRDRWSIDPTKHGATGTVVGLGTGLGTGRQRAVITYVATLLWRPKVGKLRLIYLPGVCPW